MVAPPPRLSRAVCRALAGVSFLLALQGCISFRAAPGEQPLVGDIKFVTDQQKEGAKEGSHEKAMFADELGGRIALTSSGSRVLGLVKIGEAYPYEPAGLKADRQRIERFYQSRGYFSARVVEVQTQVEKGRENITFVIHEGEPTTVKSISLTGLDAVSADSQKRALEKLPLKEGEIFREPDYEGQKILLKDRLSNEGYMRTAVDGRVEVDTDQRTARVFFDVKPGPQFRIERLRIDGILGPKEDPDVSFDRTRDASLLRTGDVVTPTNLARAREKVAAMGVFSTVDVTPEFNDASGTAVVTIKVTEAPFQTVETGVGIEADQLRQLARAHARYTNKNIGRGQQKLIIGGSLGYVFLPSIFDPNPTSGIIGDLSAQYIQPRIFRKSIDAQATIDYTKDMLPAFRFQRIGLRGGLIFYLDKVKGLSLATSVNYEYYFDVGSGPRGGNDKTSALVESGCGPDPTTNELATQCIIGYVEGQLNYDLRDNILQPRKGAFFSLNVQYAGLPLSDFRYIRYLPEARFYVPVPFTNRRLIFAGKVRYGLLQNTASEGSGKREPPGFAAFFGGGANSVRAAGTQQMGPLSFTVLDNGDSKTKAQQPFVSGVPIPLGGDHLIEGSVELRWYTPWADLGFAAFFDIGRIYTTNSAVPSGKDFAQQNIQYGPGLGLRYNTPLGPLRVDLAYRLSRVSGLNPNFVRPAAVDTSAVNNRPLPSTNPLDYRIKLDCVENDFTCYAENRLNFYLTLGEAF
jgi:outer membrane protein assembly factor BamA